MISRLWAELPGISPELAAADRAAVADWHAGGGDGDSEGLDGEGDWHADEADGASEEAEAGDEYPVLLRLISLGSSFAVRVDRMSAWQRERLLGLLEEVLVSGTEDEQNAVATGFLEALVTAYDRGDFDLATVWHELGEESRHYIKIWNTRTGVAVPYWMTLREPPEPQPAGAAVALLRESCDRLANADDRLLGTSTETRSAEPDYDLQHRVENMAAEFVRDFREIDRSSRAKVFEALEKVVLGAPEDDVTAIAERFVPALVTGYRLGVFHPMPILSGLGAHTAHYFNKVNEEMEWEME
ncbi:hypothetical protein SAMN04487905_111208 [Actinopolyspora xinjiangensis]|uniref:Uncharacterized protein n=1 Tax=Actinopolyspora xinjiangensis TaxID=405564 RepID=A0A1H0WDJ1_9ACTN|nr:hypothetical protein [Actinopolyspora xinjiangensis]SDP88535.1 hypothetical protein SAMN04487905_111208 [Actinopolyspora xinjiangensis]